MISITEAFSILNSSSFLLKEEVVLLEKACNSVLAETVFSPINMPPFQQSNMDGYALCLHDALGYEIVGEIKAGDFYTQTLQPGQALKIFTGAAVPDSAQAVIQIEKVTVNGTQLQLQKTVLPQTNIRPLGSQIQVNQIALEKGTFLNAAAIGFLVGLGLTSVKIYKKSNIGIVVTGNELVKAGDILPQGKIFESNAIMLQTALQTNHFEKVTTYQVSDDFSTTKNTLQKAIVENELVIVSGGISVGDYDFVGKALESLGVTTLFYKVNQKPGKPLLVGKQNDKFIFALPGNPAASLTCFYVYVLPTLKKLAAIPANYQSTTSLNLAHDFEVNNVRDQFLKATISEQEVTILPHQDSSMLDSFALANALLYLPSGNYKKVKGDKVVVYFI